MGKSALATGIFLSVLGVFLIIGSLVFAVVNKDRIGSVFSFEKAKTAEELKTSCIGTAGRLGFKASPVGSELIFSMAKMNNPDNDFNRSSVLIMSCSGYTMQQFCAGNKCPGGQLVLRLKAVDSK